MSILHGIMAINNAKHGRNRQTVSYYLYHGIHQDGGSGVPQRKRKRKLRNSLVGGKRSGHTAW